MQCRRFTHWIIAGLIGLVWISESKAQTITTGALSVTQVCGSTTLSVPFTQSGSFGAGNTFSVELSNNGGNFGNPLTLSPSGTASPLVVTIPNTVSNGTGYQVRVVSSNPQVIGSPSATVLTIQPTPSAPSVAQTSFTYCQNATATPLSASATGGNTLKWYDGSNNPLPGAPTPSTAAAGSQTYSVSQVSSIGCESPKVTITVQVNGIPQAPTATSPVEICEGSPASPLTATGNNLKWYDASNNLLGGAPTPSNTASSSYGVTQTVNGCESPKKTIEVTVKPKPAPPTVTASQSYCSGATLSALTATGTSLKWYDASNNLLGGAPTPSNTASSSYGVTQTVNGCESDKATISITIIQTPPPSVNANVEYCAGQTASPLTATGTNLKWYAAPTGGSALAGAPTPSTAAAGSTNYYVSQTVNGCESARAQITVTVKPLPAAPGVSAAEFCESSPASPLTASGSNLQWYTAAAGGSPLAGAPTPSTAAAGSTSYYVSQTVNGCEGPRAKLDVTVKPKPAPPTVTASQSYCFGTTIPALTATGTGLKWYDASDNPLGGAPTPSNTNSSSYKVSQTINGCESDKATISITIIQTPLPTVNANVEYCTGQTAAPLTATGTNLKWYAAPTGGSLLAGAPTPATGSAGSFTFYVSQTANSCESARAQITVTVKATPGAPGTSDVSVCEGSSTGPLTASGVNLRWYTAASGGSGSTTAPTPNTSVVGSTSYYVSQTVNGCEGPRATLSVTIRDTPDAPGVSSPVSLCFGGPTAALTATGSSLKWYTAPSGGSALGGAPTPSTAAAGTTNYYVSQTANSCESPRATITVNVYQTPAPSATSTVEYCNNATATALTASGTALKWYTTPSGGTGSTTAPVPPTSTVGNQIYYVSQTLNGCEGDRTRIDVIIKPIPVLPTITAPAPICQGGTVLPLIGSVTGATGTLKWYTAATGGTGSATAPTPSSATAGITNYYVSQTVNGCESARATLPVEIKAQPAAPTVTTPVEYCEKATAVPLTATVTGTNTLKWYTVATNGTASATAPTPTTTAVATTSYYVSQTATYTIGTGSLACEGPRAKIDVQINPLPGLPSVVALQEVCQERQDTPLTLTAGGSNLKWYNAASGGNADASAPTVNLKNAGESTFYVSQTTAKGCEGGRAEMKVRVKRLPGLPGVTPQIVYCQFDNAQPLSASPENSATLNWYGTSSAGGNRSDTPPTPSTQNGGETNYYVSQTLAGCEGDRNQIKIIVNTTPKPGVTSPIEYCQNVTAQPLSAQGSQLKWYREANATTFQTNPFTPFTANVGTFSFYVTQTGSNGCESPKERIDVRIKPLPSATISGDVSISLGQSAQISVEFTGDGPWDYVLSNNISGKGVTQNPLKITVSPERTTTYVVTEVSNSCGKGIPNGSAIVTVRIPTISTGNPTIASLCAGRTFTVPFQASGDFVAENKFNVQISLTDTDSGFRTIPSVRNGNEVVATVPDTTLGGNYFVRVVGESPQFVIKGSTSPVNVTVQPLPTATISGTTTILVGQSTTVNVAFTGASPWTFRFNNGSRDSLITTSVTPLVIPVTPAATTTYTITSVTNQCGDGKVFGTARIQVDPILGNEPVLPAADWLNVYPSPVQTICVVEIKAPLTGGEASLRVFDMSGRTVLTQKVRTSRTEVDLTAQPAGIYFLRIQNGARTEVRRILKQN